VELVFVGLQAFQLLFMLLHDWIPIGRLNDLAGVRSQNSRGALLRDTAINATPALATFGVSLAFVGRPYPAWAKTLLIGVLGALVAGEMLAWWVPYFAGTTQTRVDRYRAMFGRTHAFLRERNGITPNTLHVALHATTMLSLAVAVWLARIK